MSVPTRGAENTSPSVAAVADVVIRPAEEADDAALVALAAACPMKAGMTLCVHRGPEFFALSRIQGAPWHVLVAESPADGVVGCGGAAVRRLWLGGRPTDVMYAGDLKLHPRFRGRGLGDRILDAGWQLCADAGLPSFMAALAGNGPIERRVARPPVGLPQPATLGTVRVYTLLLPGLRLPGLRLPGLALRLPGFAAPLRVRPAGLGDVDAMMTLWARVAPLRDGAPVMARDEFLDFVERAPGLQLSDYLLAFRGQTLVGSVGVWNQESFKETRVLDFGRSVDCIRRAHDTVARRLGWPLLPDRGQPLRALHAVHLCVPRDEPGALRALLHEGRRRCVRDGAVALELGLDPGDPLVRALRPFPRIGVDVRCYSAYQEIGRGGEGCEPVRRSPGAPLHF